MKTVFIKMILTCFDFLQFNLIYFSNQNTNPSYPLSGYHLL